MRVPTQSDYQSWRPAIVTDFQHRCASALMHPATVSALGVLLLNDLVFKAMWPGSWVTGKLSDLAWVVFASPLLGFLLSFLVGKNSARQRAAFLASYVGLPILYAAFNTFEPVHVMILRGLSVASGSPVGSPLDVADSLVIPFGLGIAWWVWRGKIAGTNSLRMRSVLLIAGFAALASVATSIAPPDPTEWFTGLSNDKTLIMKSPRGYYGSTDGGITWTKASQSPGSDVQWGGTRVETPRGIYTIEGPDINLLTRDGESIKVYSVDFLAKESNKWAQKYSTRRLRSNLTDLYDDPQRRVVTEPINIVYDERTTNVVIAMGLQGVLVGDSDETWKPVAVGEFVPTDLSFGGKARLMSSLQFWLGGLGFSLAFAAGVLALSQRRLSLPAIPVATRLRGVLLFLTTLVPVLFFVALFGGTSLFIPFITAVLVLLVVSLPFTLVALAWGWPGQSNVRKVIAFFFAIPGAALSFSSLPPFGGGVGVFYIDVDFFFAIVGLTIALTALVIYPPRRIQLTTFAVAMLSMIASIILPFMLWLTGGLTLTVATLASIGLVLQLQICGERFQAAFVMAEPGYCLVPPSPPGPQQH